MVLESPVLVIRGDCRGGVAKVSKLDNAFREVVDKVLGEVQRCGWNVEEPPGVELSGFICLVDVARTRIGI